MSQASAPYGHADGLASVAYAPSQRAGADGALLFNGDCQRTNTTRGIYTTDNAVHAVEGGTLIALAPRPRTFLAELSILSETEGSATPLVAAWRLDVVCQVVGPVLSIIIIRDPYNPRNTYTPAYPFYRIRQRNGQRAIRVHQPGSEQHGQRPEHEHRRPIRRM